MFIGDLLLVGSLLFGSIYEPLEGVTDTITPGSHSSSTRFRVDTSSGDTYATIQTWTIGMSSANSIVDLGVESYDVTFVLGIGLTSLDHFDSLNQSARYVYIVSNDNNYNPPLPYDFIIKFNMNVSKIDGENENDLIVFTPTIQFFNFGYTTLDRLKDSLNNYYTIGYNLSYKYLLGTGAHSSYMNIVGSNYGLYGAWNGYLNANHSTKWDVVNPSVSLGFPGEDLNLIKTYEIGNNTYFRFLFTFDLVAFMQQENKQDIINNAYNDGYNTGYEIGKQDGINTNLNDTNPITLAFSSLDNIFSVEIFPGFKLWYLLGIPLIIALIFLVLKAFH